jgi:hypothetical protein
MHVNSASYGLNGFRKELQECMSDLTSFFSLVWPEVSNFRYAVQQCNAMKENIQSRTHGCEAYPPSALQLCDCGHERQKIAISWKQNASNRNQSAIVCSSPWIEENDTYRAPKARNRMLLSSGIYMTDVGRHEHQVRKSICLSPWIEE